MNMTFYPQLSIKILNILIAAVICLVIAGCSKDDDDIGKGGITSIEHCLRFTEDFKKDEGEVIKISSDAQTIQLNLKGVEGYDIPMPDKLTYNTLHWDADENIWLLLTPSQSIPHDSFYHVTSEDINGKTIISVNFTANDSDKERQLKIVPMAESPYMPQILLQGWILIIQSPNGSESETI